MAIFPQVKIWDGTNTAAVTSDGSLQVSQSASISPASVLMQNAATSAGNGTEMSVSGYNTALLQIDRVSFGTTVVFEATMDDSEWFPITGYQVGTNTTGTQS